MNIENYNPNSNLEKTAIEFLKLLNENSKAYFIGGYPRDLLINKFSNKKNITYDIDICINKNENEVIEILNNIDCEYKILKKKFGVFIIKYKDYKFELACFRKDIGKSDYRNPKSIKFTKNIKKDSKRRDFTVNSIYFDPIENKIYDFNNGIKDIKNNRIRFIGNIKKRIKEDNLRIIRYLRLKNKYNFKADKKTIKQIEKFSKNIKVSNYQFKKELNKTLESKNSSVTLYDLDRFSILERFIEEINDIKNIKLENLDNNLFEAILYKLNFVDNEDFYKILEEIKVFNKKEIDKLNKYNLIKIIGTEFLWAILFQDLGKTKIYPENIDGEKNYKNFEAISKDIFSKKAKLLNFSNISREKIEFLILNQNKLNNIKNIDKEKLDQLIKSNYILDLFILFIVNNSYLNKNFDKDLLKIKKILKLINF
ncbi:CCA tRNA nucleotidyltransferase [bacterium]|nr:CCA tRNA nucleotidyltransferase [bacterium]